MLDFFILPGDILDIPKGRVMIDRETNIRCVTKKLQKAINSMQPSRGKVHGLISGNGGEQNRLTMGNNDL
jgi:hypothetical protein